MLKIRIEGTEFYDEAREEFITTKPQILQLEHSLISLSRWESKWCKPFLDPKTEKNQEESMDYIRCMCLNQNVDPTIFLAIDDETMKQVYEYINAPMTATTFWGHKQEKPSREIVTSELIYYWMVALQIPFECQKWHLNRLLTLIRVCNVKNSGPKKMSKRELMQRNRSLNAQRKARMGTNG